MAKGDVVMVAFAAAGAYQPAAGVEVIITALTGISTTTANVWALYDGTNTNAVYYVPISANPTGISAKIPVNNTIYLYSTIAGTAMAGGIQVK